MLDAAGGAGAVTAVAAASRVVSTPGWLRRAAVAVAVSAVLAGGLVLWTAAGISDAARTIGRDAEPSVALALGMTAVLAEMNASALGDALVAGAASGTSRAFREDGYGMADSLVRAAQNITYGEAEAGPLRRLQQALAMYQEAVAESRDAGDAWVRSRRVEWAGRVNTAFAAPAAQALADANARVLEDRWAAYEAAWLPLGIAAFVAVGVLAAVLVGVQLWLAGRTRRLVNLPLAGGTMVAMAAALWFGAAVLRAHSQLRAAKADAYDSLKVLFQAEAQVSALQAATSLWLLDGSARAEAQAGVDGAERALLGMDAVGPAEARAMQAALATERAGDAARARAQAPKLGGLLGAEMANVTFGVPEREAATDAVNRTLAAEAYVRSAQSGAVTSLQWLDGRPGGGDAVFAAVQAALDRTIVVNQGEFDVDTAAALAGARVLAPVMAAALLAAVTLAWGGLWLRLREYR